MKNPNVKHTPGPWKSEGPTVVNGPIGIIKDTMIGNVACKYHVATSHRASMGTKFGGLEECEANAALIAAAPEMLEALELCLNQLSDGSTEDHQFRISIIRLLAKARGEL